MLSIDITDRQIKFVRGVHSGNKIRIQDADMRELSPGMISNGYVTDVPMVAAELNGIIKSKDVKEKEAIVSISSSSIVYKELTVAKPKNMKNPAIIEAMIQSEMNVTNEYNISFTIAGETEDAEKNKLLKVMAAACPQRLVDGYVRLFSHIGLQLKAVNIANNSVTRIIVNSPKLAETMPLMLVQVDSNFMNINLYENGQLVFTRFAAIDPNDFENASDYMYRAVYLNVFRMNQFIEQRNDLEMPREIMYYGEFGSRTNEVATALGSFNTKVTLLPMPSTVSTNIQFDFTRYANAIGALYRQNKEIEHINLLEATSAKESKSGSGFLVSLLGVMIGSAAAVGAAYAGVTFWENSIKADITTVQRQIDDPTLNNDLDIVDDRDQMLAGFQNYNSTVNAAVRLFNYSPKVQSAVIDKVREPLAKLKDVEEGESPYPECSLVLNDDELDFEDSILTEGQRLDLTSINIADGGSVEVTFRGVSKGDPSDIPSKMAKALVNDVLNKYGQPYFVNVQYTGFTKENISEEGTIAVLNQIRKVLELEGEITEQADIYDTYFTFNISMELRPGSDEEHTDIDTDLGLSNGETEVTE